MTTRIMGAALAALLLSGVACGPRQVKRPPDAAHLLDIAERLYEDRTYDMAAEMYAAAMRLQPRAKTAAKLRECERMARR
jgi:hypothetical protein